MRRRLAPLLLGLAGYVAVALLFSWPLPLHFTTTLTGPPSSDTGVYVWNLWAFQRELLEQRSFPLSTTAIFAGDLPGDLSQHNYTLFSNVLAIPLTPLLGLVGAFNAIYLLTHVLAAFAAFLLARRVTGDTPAAWLAGLLFGFSPALIARSTAHFSLVAAAPLALFALLLLRVEERGTRGSAVALGATMAWAAVSDPYYAIYCALIGAFHLAVPLDRHTRAGTDHARATDFLAARRMRRGRARAHRLDRGHRGRRVRAVRRADDGQRIPQPGPAADCHRARPPVARPPPRVPAGADRDNVATVARRTLGGPHLRRVAVAIVDRTGHARRQRPVRGTGHSVAQQSVRSGLGRVDPAESEPSAVARVPLDGMVDDAARWICRERRLDPDRRPDRDRRGGHRGAVARQPLLDWFHHGVRASLARAFHPSGGHRHVRPDAVGTAEIRAGGRVGTYANPFHRGGDGRDLGPVRTGGRGALQTLAALASQASSRPLAWCSLSSFCRCHVRSTPPQRRPCTGPSRPTRGRSGCSRFHMASATASPTRAISLPRRCSTRRSTASRCSAGTCRGSPRAGSSGLGGAP